MLMSGRDARIVTASLAQKLSLSLVLGTVACSGRSRLVDIVRPSLMVGLRQDPGGELAVRIFPEEEGTKTTDARASDRCTRPAPKAKASFNGFRLERLTGTYARGDFKYDRDCLLEFAFAGEPTEPNTTGEVAYIRPVPTAARSANPALLRIEDASAVWNLEIPNAFAPRALRIVSPQDGVVRRGTPTTVEWSPPTDQLGDRKVGVELRPAGTPPGQGLIILDLEVRGPRFVFTVPKESHPAWKGPALLTFLGTGYVKAALGPCPVNRCGLDMGFTVEPLPITLED